MSSKHKQKSKKLKKSSKNHHQSHVKEEYEYESNEEDSENNSSEEESEEEEDKKISQDQYEYDDFVVGDNEGDDGNNGPMPAWILNAKDQNKIKDDKDDKEDKDKDDKDDQVSDDSLTNSDLDVIDAYKKRKLIKNKHKGAKEDVIKEDEFGNNNEFIDDGKAGEGVGGDDEKYFGDVKAEDALGEDVKERRNYAVNKKAPHKVYEHESLSHRIFHIPEEELESDENINTNPILNQNEAINISSDKFIKIDLEEPLKSKYTNEELENEYATTEDLKIKSLDYPERLITMYKSKEKELSIIGEPSLIEREVEWMIEKLNLQLNSTYELIENTKKKIYLVLSYNKKEFLDVPFIIAYRKYAFEPELTVKDVWKIFQYDYEYLELETYKKNVLNQFDNIVNLNPSQSNKILSMKEPYIINAKSINDLKYMEDFINFKKEEFGGLQGGNNNLSNDQKPAYIPPLKSTIVTMSIKYKLNEYVSKFSLDCIDLAHNLEKLNNNESTGLIPAPEPEIEFNTLTRQYMDDKKIFKKELELIQFACKYLAKEMGSHPVIKNYIYEHYKKNCFLSTTPTEKGNNELDIFHPSFRVKRIKNKPINHFNNDLFLDILQNEKLGLITINIEINDSNDNSFNDIKNRLCTAYFLNNSNNDINEKNGWNIIREEAIRLLVDQELKTSFLKQIREDLKKQAEDFIINQCADNFYNLINSGAYRKHSKINSNEGNVLNENNLTKVMSFVYDPNRKCTYCVVLNEYGEVIEYEIFEYLAIKLPKNYRDGGNNYNNPYNIPLNANLNSGNTITTIKHSKELNTLKDILKKQRPDVIIIGANDLKCTYIREHINKQIENYNNEINNNNNSNNNLNSGSNEGGGANNNEKNTIDSWVTYGDLHIPQIYAKSIYSEKSFPNHDLYLKMAISLGRYLQSPMDEILQLWNNKMDKNFCMKINLHPLQGLVDQRKLMNAMELKAIQVVNSVGVDINNCFDYVHMRNTLSFISGLGPRKAHLLFEKTMKNHIYLKIQLIKILGKNVTKSCYGFFRIKQDINSTKKKTKRYDLLDCTRINDEMHKLACNMCISAASNLENDENDDDLLDDDSYNNSNNNIQKTILSVLKHPKLLDKLDITEYIKTQSNLENKNNVNIHQLKFNATFIKNELNNPFNDTRTPHKALSNEEVFLLLIGDPKFTVGQITTAQVLRVEKEHVKCRLMNGLEATVWVKDIFEDNENIPDPNREMNNRFKPGSVFEARIKSINGHNYKIDLQTKQSVMKTHKEHMDLEGLDQYFNLTDEDVINKKYTENTNASENKYIPRMINHEKFKNISYRNCLKYLADKEIGDFLFRPSSKGINNLTLTWKFYKNNYCHIDVEEKEKNNAVMAISSGLKIGNEYYSNLNEIIERYINPCNLLIKDIIKSRKFNDCETKKELEEKLKYDKNKDPNIICYYFSILKEYPQFVILAYIPKKEIIYEYIKIKPNGFSFHQKVFKKVEDIIKYFKENFSTYEYREYAKKTKEPKIQYNKNLELNSNININNNNNYGFKGKDGKMKDMSNIECFICHQHGHTKANCPNKNSGNERRGGRYNNNNGEFRGKRNRSPNNSNNNFGGDYKRRSYDNRKNEDNNNNNNNGSNNANWENSGNDGWGDGNGGWGNSNNEQVGWEGAGNENDKKENVKIENSNNDNNEEQGQGGWGTSNNDGNDNGTNWENNNNDDNEPKWG